MSNTGPNTEVSVIGAGISGLHTAYELAKRGKMVTVLEASERVGGRILSQPMSSSSEFRFDLGPSWFWPGQQSIHKLVIELELHDRVFSQYAAGDALYEPVGQPLQRGVQGLSMQNSYRLLGGLATITDALRERIINLAGPDAIKLGSQVSTIELQDKGGVLIRTTDNLAMECDQVVLALPPRVAINSIEFSPELSTGRKNELSNVSTWMAGHAKAVIIYDTPFWRNAGLSGDAFSQRGPLSEIHDASFSRTATGKDEKFALFGFFSTLPKHRETDPIKLREQIVAQLVRLFGDVALEPAELLYKNWADDPLVATEQDQHIPNHHPMNQLSATNEAGWQNRLLWSGTETADGHYNGYIEGALIASHATLEKLKTGVEEEVRPK